ncbi:unnamed protein product [Ectocarpus sp. 12 AP-2014]
MKGGVGVEGEDEPSSERIPLGQKSRSTIRGSLVEDGLRSLVTLHASSWLGALAIYIAPRDNLSEANLGNVLQGALATSTSLREIISPRRMWGTFSKERFVLNRTFACT